MTTALKNALIILLIWVFATTPVFSALHSGSYSAANTTTADTRHESTNHAQHHTQVKPSSNSTLVFEHHMTHGKAPQLCDKQSQCDSCDNCAHCPNLVAAPYSMLLNQHVDNITPWLPIPLYNIDASNTFRPPIYA